MKEILSRFNRWDYIFTCILGVLYFALISQYIPCMDDMKVFFVSQENGESNAFASLMDVIDHEIYVYFHWSGRIFVHTLVLWFSSCNHRFIFFIGSTFFFIIFIISLTYLIRRKTNRHNLYDIPLLSMILLIFTPQIGVVFFGNMALVINYLWGAAMYSLFVVIYIKLSNNEIALKWWKSIFLIVFAFLCGAMQESFGLGIGGALFLYHIRHIKQTKGTLLWFLLSFAIGLLFLMLAPGNFERYTDSVNDKGGVLVLLSKTAVNIVKLLMSGYFWFFFVVLISLCIKHNNNLSEYFAKNFFYVTSAFVVLLFAIVITYTAPRQLFWLFLVSIILLWEFIPENKNSNIVITTVLMLLCISIMCQAYYYRSKQYNAYLPFQSSITNAVDTVAYSTELEKFMIQMDTSNNYFNKYINEEVYYSFWDLHDNLNHYLTRNERVYTTVALPEPIPSIVAQCDQSNCITENVYDYKSYPIYCIVVIPDSISSDIIKLYTKANTKQSLKDGFNKSKFRDVCRALMIGVGPLNIYSSLHQNEHIVNIEVVKRKEFSYYNKKYILIEKPVWVKLGYKVYLK